MNVLLLSSSKVGSGDYLASAKTEINALLKTKRNIVFIPYAGVTISHDDYANKVREALPELNISSLHEYKVPLAAINDADAVLVGGGNTFNLLHTLYRFDLVGVLKERVQENQISYIGWSAGSNVAGMSIRTTNDMPIIEPPTFNGIDLVPFQINPHFTDYKPAGHNGETRSERLQEFMALNPTTPILALPEGTGLQITGDQWHLTGTETCFVFKGGEKVVIENDNHLKQLLSNN